MLPSPLPIPLVVPKNGHWGAARPRRNGIHHGLDFVAPTGTDVYAVAAGTVAHVKFDPPVKQGGHGGGVWVGVSHAGGAESRYMHLSSVLVTEGQDVIAGALVGRVGTSGTEASGPHLHFALLQDGQPIDPTSLMPIARMSSSGSSSGGGGAGGGGGTKSSTGDGPTVVLVGALLGALAGAVRRWS